MVVGDDAGKVGELEELEAVELQAGADPLPSVPMKDRDIFDLLGFD